MSDDVIVSTYDTPSHLCTRHQPHFATVQTQDLNHFLNFFSPQQESLNIVMVRPVQAVITVGRQDLMSRTSFIHRFYCSKMLNMRFSQLYTRRNWETLKAIFAKFGEYNFFSTVVNQNIKINLSQEMALDVMKLDCCWDISDTWDTWHVTAADIMKIMEARTAITRLEAGLDYL